MRTNLPVLSKEYALEPAASLISTTYLKGRILRCNGAFVIPGGFNDHALMG